MEKKEAGLKRVELEACEDFVDLSFVCSGTACEDLALRGLPSDLLGIVTGSDVVVTLDEHAGGCRAILSILVSLGEELFLCVKLSVSRAVECL